MRRLAIAFLAAAPLLLAQVPGTALGGSANGFSGPSLGFLPGSTPGELQPILGIPGAARLGDAISLPNTVTQLYLAPGHSYALAVQGPADPVASAILRVPAGIEASPRLAPLPGALAQPDLVAFSPAGQSAALYSQQANRLEVFTGLPNSPRLAQDISNVQLAGPLLKLAISDDAQAVLVSDASGTVYTLSQNTAPRPVYHSSQISALVFISQSHDAVVCDPVLGAAALLQAVNSSPGIKMLPQASNNGCQPQAAVSTADGKTILLACPAQHLIWWVDRASQSTNTFKINNSPATLDTVGGRDVFLMSPPDEGAYWLLTWGPEGPATSFIAAARHTNQGPPN